MKIRFIVILIVLHLVRAEIPFEDLNRRIEGNAQDLNRATSTDWKQEYFAFGSDPVALTPQNQFPDSILAIEKEKKGKMLRPSGEYLQKTLSKPQQHIQASDYYLSNSHPDQVGKKDLDFPGSLAAGPGVDISRIEEAQPLLVVENGVNNELQRSKQIKQQVELPRTKIDDKVAHLFGWIWSSIDKYIFHQDLKQEEENNSSASSGDKAEDKQIMKVKQNRPNQTVNIQKSQQQSSLSIETQKGEQKVSEQKEKGMSFVASTGSSKKRSSKYFVLGTLLFGGLALMIVKIIKQKEDESEDMNRSGISVPLEQTQIQPE